MSNEAYLRVPVTHNDEVERLIRVAVEAAGKQWAALLQQERETANAIIADHSARVAALEETLVFYADPDTYFAIGIFPDPPCGEFMDDFSETEELGAKPGKCARVALGWEPAESAPSEPHQE